MTPQEIMDLPVQDIAAQDCVLFLWTTWPMLLEGSTDKVIRAWGFTPKTAGFVWIKTNKQSKSLFWGMGHYSRSNSEVCVLAVRGKPKRIDAGVHQVIMSPVRAHSQKPDEQYGLIERLMGDLPRIELFARQRWPGWDSWGDEVPEEVVSAR
jgi:N6-adenosine-specific RNA methylase IME4